MNAGQLQAYVEQHKPVVLGVAAAGVAGLALLRRKRAASAGATGPATSQPAGTIPAAAVVPSQQTASTYDSSAYDVYNALSGQLEQMRQTVGTPAATQAPKPIASTLFAPSGTGNYVRYKNGTIGEVESDGSIYGIAPGEIWNVANGYTQLAPDMESKTAYFDKLKNLSNAGGG